jgi:acyl-CoA thioesterase-1
MAYGVFFIRRIGAGFIRARLTAACMVSLMALAVAPAFAAPERVLLCLGDSLTAGYGLDEDQAWPELLQKRLDRELPGWRVVNAGVSGDTTTDALARLDWVLRSAPTAAFVCLGANDGLRGQPVADIERRLDAVLARLRNAGVAVTLAGMQVPSNLGTGYRRDFKALFARAARRNSAAFMPFLLEGVGGLPALNQADGAHPNAAGERVIARHVADFLIPRLRALKPGGGPIVPPRVLRRRDDLDPRP